MRETISTRNKIKKAHLITCTVKSKNRLTEGLKYALTLVLRKALQLN